MHDKRMTNRARDLRKAQTKAEKVLSIALRNRQLMGYKFRRQYLIKGFIVDFISLKPRLMIEVDGGQHQLRQQYDQVRTEVFSAGGYRVLRFKPSPALRAPSPVKQEREGGAAFFGEAEEGVRIQNFTSGRF